MKIKIIKDYNTKDIPLTTSKEYDGEFTFHESIPLISITADDGLPLLIRRDSEHILFEYVN